MLINDVISSIAKHFKEKLPNNRLHIPGHLNSLQTPDLEIRFHGPIVNVFSTHTEIQIQINILISEVMSESNTYSIYTTMSNVLAAFIDIPLYIDSEQKGCLVLESEVNSSYYGQVDKTTKVRQAAVEGFYRAILEA